MTKLTKEQFIEKAREVHGDLYGYDDFEYHGTQIKSAILCKIHGLFQQHANHHIGSKRGCPVCSKEKKSRDKTMTLEQFIEKAKKIHKNDCSYDEFVYVNSQTKGKIKCNIHDIVFFQIPAHHLQGHTSCELCIKQKAKETYLDHFGVEHFTKSSEFREKVKKTSLERFGVEHASKRPEFRDIIKETSLAKYGVEFASQSPQHQERIRQTNLAKYGASHFARSHHAINAMEIVDDKEKLTEFLQKYSINEAVPLLGMSDCTIGRYCHKHGIELSNSSYETAIATFLRSLDLDVKRNDRKLIKPQEIDILIPEYKIGIEICGLYWHGSLNNEDKNYHLNKLKRMNDIGYRLISIFEDEWLHKRKIVESRLRNLVGKSPKGIGARKLLINEIKNSRETVEDFLNQYHIQGYGTPGYKNYGAYDQNELVAVMTFSRPRVSLGRKEGAYELSRFAANGKNYPGLASKMFARYISDENPEEVISYADRRWSEGNLYYNLKFQYEKETRPNYWYVNETNKTREHRFNYRKSEIKHLVENGHEKTEKQIMNELKRYWIYDCGSLRFRWRNK